MRSKPVLVLVVTASAALWAADKVQPLNVKLGLWEVTTTVTTSGQMPVPAGLLEKLTPEQRARIEERIKARPSHPMKETTNKYCLTRERLDKGVNFGEDRKSCTRTMVSSSSSKIDERLECVENGVKSEGKIEFEAIDAENVTGRIQFAATGGDRTINSTSTFNARWISPICGTTK